MADGKKGGKKSLPRNTLTADAAEAKEKGISYGKLMAERQKARELTERPELKRTVYSHGVCKRCGKAFPIYSRAHREYCSIECKNRARWQRERERKREKEEGH